jgi:excisionase family DNA binding protein
MPRRPFVPPALNTPSVTPDSGSRRAAPARLVEHLSHLPSLLPDEMATIQQPSESVLPATAPSPWLTVTEAAERARCGPKLIYREVKAGRLRAAKVGGRRELRLLPEWIDAWLFAHTTIP